VLFGDWGPEYALNPQGNMLFSLDSLNGYGPFQLRRFREMMGGMLHNGLVCDPALLEPSKSLDVWACRYVIVNHATGQDLPAVLEDPARFRLALTEAPLSVYENLHVLPHARLVDEVSALGGAPAVLRALTTGRLDSGRPIEPARAMLTESAQDHDRLAPSPAAPSGPSESSVDWRAYGSRGLCVGTSADRPAVLVLAEPFLDGWEAWIDGRPAPIVRADYLLRALPVPAGVHRIEMRYTPKGLYRGLIVSAAGVAGLAILAGWGLAFARKRGIVPAH
jgi:hypothetical protein